MKKMFAMKVNSFVQMAHAIRRQTTQTMYKTKKKSQMIKQKTQDNKKIIGSSLVEEGLEIVDGADDGSVQAARLKAEQRRWMAERYNRSEYGKPDATVNVVSIGSDFLSALKQVEEEVSKPEEIVIEAEIIEPEDG